MSEMNEAHSMDPERWKRVDDLLQSALRLPSDERSAFLHQACGSDPSLEKDVESLLMSQQAMGSFLEHPAFVLVAEALATGHDEESFAIAGQSIGPYRLVQLLGTGGMGEVWRAEQDEPIRRTVALKLIKPGMDTRAVESRFNSERQALAMMDHPNIAKVFDAGAASSGQPYFVMEYVPGITITEYCDRHQLTIKERLGLFVHVCEGVMHAHQKAVIHRDLKPSNILVVEIDGNPVPKIIDFGLAKATAGHLTGHSLYTELGVMIGTPSYMSPEQADSLGCNVDTRTDVYSLGVILFELLVGVLPLDSRELHQAGVEAILRNIRESEAPRPSARFSTLGLESSELAVRRKEEPQSLVRHLRGDLDWITLKAMEKDRARRYASASELAVDIRRYLEEQPILAGPPSVVYRARKFVRRHRIGVAVASVIIALIVVGSVIPILQAHRIARERDRAAREAVAAKSVSDFLIGLFHVSDPSEARGNSITAREILDRGRDQMETSLKDQPEIQARMMDAMGEVYTSLGLYTQAQPLLEKALSWRERLLGPEHPDTLSTMLHLARNLERLGRYSEAEKLVWTVFDFRVRVLGPEHPDTLTSRHAIIILAVDKGDYVGAEQLNREEVNILRRIRGPEAPETLTSMYTLALAIADQGRSAEAIDIYRQVLGTERRVLGPTNPSTLTTMSSFGRALADAGKYDEAEALLRETLDAKRHILGLEHSETLWAMHNLAQTLRLDGHPAEAESLERQTLAIRRHVLGPEHPETLMSMTDLAADLDDLHRFAEAERLYSDSIEIKTRVLGGNHPETAVSKYNYACNLALRGQRAKALSNLRDAVDHGLPLTYSLAIERDTDLNSLHNTPEFTALLTHIQQLANARERQK